MPTAMDLQRLMWLVAPPLDLFAALASGAAWHRSAAGDAAGHVAVEFSRPQPGFTLSTSAGDLCWPLLVSTGARVLVMLLSRALFPSSSQRSLRQEVLHGLPISALSIFCRLQGLTVSVAEDTLTWSPAQLAVETGFSMLHLCSSAAKFPWTMNAMVGLAVAASGMRQERNPLVRVSGSLFMGVDQMRRVLPVQDWLYTAVAVSLYTQGTIALSRRLAGLFVRKPGHRRAPHQNAGAPASDDASTTTGDAPRSTSSSATTNTKTVEERMEEARASLRRRKNRSKAKEEQSSSSQATSTKAEAKAKRSTSSGGAALGVPEEKQAAVNDDTVTSAASSSSPAKPDKPYRKRKPCILAQEANVRFVEELVDLVEAGDVKTVTQILTEVENGTRHRSDYTPCKCAECQEPSPVFQQVQADRSGFLLGLLQSLDADGESSEAGDDGTYPDLEIKTRQTLRSQYKSRKTGLMGTVSKRTVQRLEEKMKKEEEMKTLDSDAGGASEPPPAAEAKGHQRKGSLWDIICYLDDIIQHGSAEEALQASMDKRRLQLDKTEAEESSASDWTSGDDL